MTASSPSAPGESRRLGSSYVLTTLIGSGAQGEVWLASRTDSPSARFAIKLLRADILQDGGTVERFVRERATLMRVHSPYVVGVRDMVIEGSTAAIVMDYVGGDLRGLLNEVGTLPPAEIARLGVLTARGLEAVHAAGIVHRDVKPANILIDLPDVTPVEDPDATWVPRLADFGVARITDTVTTSHATGAIGTPLYMAPEILDVEAPTAVADIYSLGIILYEAACGVPPFVGAPSQVLGQHARRGPGRPEGVPDSLWALISAMLAKQPEARPDAGQIAGALEAAAPALAGLPAAPRLQSPPPPVPAVSPYAWNEGPSVPLAGTVDGLDAGVRGGDEGPGTDAGAAGAGSGPTAPAAAPTLDTVTEWHTPTLLVPPVPAAAGPDRTSRPTAASGAAYGISPTPPTSAGAYGISPQTQAPSAYGLYDADPHQAPGIPYDAAGAGAAGVAGAAGTVGVAAGRPRRRGRTIALVSLVVVLVVSLVAGGAFLWWRRSLAEEKAQRAGTLSSLPAKARVVELRRFEDVSDYTVSPDGKAMAVQKSGDWYLYNIDGADQAAVWQGDCNKVRFWNNSTLFCDEGFIAGAGKVSLISLDGSVTEQVPGPKDHNVVTTTGDLTIVIDGSSKGDLVALDSSGAEAWRRVGDYDEARIRNGFIYTYDERRKNTQVVSAATGAVLYEQQVSKSPDLSLKYSTLGEKKGLGDDGQVAMNLGHNAFVVRGTPSSLYDGEGNHIADLPDGVASWTVSGDRSAQDIADALAGATGDTNSTRLIGAKSSMSLTVDTLACTATRSDKDVTFTPPTRSSGEDCSIVPEGLIGDDSAVLFTTGKATTGSKSTGDYVIAYDKDSGEELWRTRGTLHRVLPPSANAGGDASGQPRIIVAENAVGLSGDLVVEAVIAAS